MLTSVVSSYPSDANAHTLLGRLWRERNEPEQAISEFDIAIQSNDSLAAAYIEKANLQMMNGNLGAAAETLNVGLQRNKDNLLLRGFLAKVLAANISHRMH
jgi:tetratricopeptide (TPR) repeat protein